MRLTYLVLYTREIDRCRNFYRDLGFALIEESHRHGPTHYACTLDNVVIELFPSIKEPTRTRLGLIHPNLEAMLKVRTDLILNPAGNYEVKDPNGTTIEFLKNTVA